VPNSRDNPSWKTDGKFFHRGGNREWMRAVTYGPFPPEKERPAAVDFPRIREAGFNTLRVFTLPDQAFLDAAEKAGLQVFGGIDSWQYADFLSRPGVLSGAKVTLSEWLKTHADHPALSGVYVGNEVSSDLVRWMGPAVVRRAIEDLIELGRGIAPHLLFAYANYPSTEYLEPANADFSSFNIYLEEPEAFANYLRRLQNIAGDRPLVVSEFGMDSFRNGTDTQASVIRWALETSHREETAGMTIYSWCDLWENNGAEITDWSFGLTDREGSAKPALAACETFTPPPPAAPASRFSVIVCTRNGRKNIAACLRSIAAMTGGPYETIVVDDGSTDGTSEFISKDFLEVRLLTIPPSGLSAARNAGAAAAKGEVFAFTDDDCEPDTEWIARLDKAFRDPDIAAAGGPNLPPPARTLEEAVIRAAPGAPSHVLLDDTRAEHLPGCNISVRREAFEKIGGFDPIFRTAGDDVDFCWRLSDAEFAMGFVPGAFVWHWRRPSIRAFLRQQTGYGKAEKLLLKKHPQRFTANGEARWEGFIYGGGSVRAAGDSIIYYGSMGQAGYQSIVNRMLPLRQVDSAFKSFCSGNLLSLVKIFQPAIRRWARNRRVKFTLPAFPKSSQQEEIQEFRIPGSGGKDRFHYLDLLLDDGWQPAGDTDPWDVTKDGTKVLIATERLNHNHTVNLFRVLGDHIALLPLITMGAQRT
tara:strand:- start:59269 stop:61362 length:2094 start_codon:yes stop_codon:yes gene_type:complete